MIGDISRIRSQFNISEDAANRLLNLLRFDERGFPYDLVSPLIDRRAEDKDVERLNLARPLLALIESYCDLGFLVEAERSQLQKIGAYSVILPFAHRLDKLNVYFEPKVFDVDIDLFNQAVEYVKEMIPQHHLNTINLDEASIHTPKNTNSGMPFCAKGLEFWEHEKTIAQAVIDSDYTEFRDDPALHFTRGQPRGFHEVSKNRDVWGEPKWLVMLGEMVQVPLLQYLRQLPEFAAWVHRDVVDTTMDKLLKRSNGNPLLSLDFSGYDASVPKELIQAAFSCLTHWFVDDDGGHIAFLEERFLSIGILTPIGELRNRDGAVPSGDALTNMIDTICQRIAIQYIALRLGIRVDFHIAQGDDGVVLFDGVWNLDQITDIALEMNLRLSSDKGGVSSTTVYFCQDVFSLDYQPNGQVVGVRPIMRTLNSMMSYERLRDPEEWNPYMDTLRWWQQCENSKWHPLFRNLVDFLYKHDRISKAFDASTVLRRAGGIRKVESLLNEKSFPVGKEPISTVKQFKTVKLLAQMGTSRRK